MARRRSTAASTHAFATIIALRSASCRVGNLAELVAYNGVRCHAPSSVLTDTTARGDQAVLPTEYDPASIWWPLYIISSVSWATGGGGAGEVLAIARGADTRRVINTHLR